MLTIYIRENERALQAITAYRASALEARVVGVPGRFDNVQVHFGAPGTEACNACACDEKPGGEWYCYANGAFFQHVGKSHFHVTARTERGDSVYLGGGTLFIEQSILNVPDGHVPVIPEDTWVRGANGLYYRVTADVDADGVPFMVVDKNGVSK